MRTPEYTQYATRIRQIPICFTLYEKTAQRSKEKSFFGIMMLFKKNGRNLICDDVFFYMHPAFGNTVSLIKIEQR